VVIPTCNRSAALRRCLSGLIANCERYSHNVDIIIYDSSGEMAQIQSNIGVVDQCRQLSSNRILLLGASERERVAATLVRAGISSETVSFALEGMPSLGLVHTGASRNILSLVTAGKNVLSLDDDTEIRFSVHRSSIVEDVRESTRITKGPEICHNFYCDRSDLLASLDLSDIDLVGHHEEFLGVHTVSNASQPSTDRRVREGVSRIGLTVNGIVGDCGWGSPSQYLFLDNQSIERMARTEASYRRTVTSREMLRTSCGESISETGGSFMSCAYGREGGLQFPPFIPIARGSDVICASLVKLLNPEVLFCHLAAAIVHSPVDRRRFWLGEVTRSASATDLCTALNGALLSTPRADGMTLTILGNHLIDLSSRSTAELKDILRTLRDRNTQTRVRHLEHTLESYQGKSGQFVSDVQHYIGKLIEGDQNFEAAVPAELLYGRDLSAALKLTQRILRLYGETLRAWPSVWNISGAGQREWLASTLQ